MSCHSRSDSAWAEDHFFPHLNRLKLLQDVLQKSSWHCLETIMASLHPPRCTVLQEICQELRFQHKVQAAAITFLKRFYLGQSAMDHDPKDVMLACIYLACKAWTATDIPWQIVPPSTTH